MPNGKMPRSEKGDAQAPTSLLELQRRAARAGGEEEKLNVRLFIDGSDADGVRFFDELLPVSLIRAILNPEIEDFFIPIAGVGRMKPRIARGHWLHTSYIREVVLLGELPEEEEK